MKVIFKSELVVLLSLCILIAGCGLFSKSEKGQDSGKQISIIVQLRKNADIESLAAQHKTLNLKAVKILSARMNTWEMTINYRLEDVDKALRLLKDSQTIINAQLNHEVKQRNN